MRWNALSDMRQKDHQIFEPSPGGPLFGEDGLNMRSLFKVRCHPPAIYRKTDLKHPTGYAFPDVYAPCDWCGNFETDNANKEGLGEDG